MTRRLRDLLAEQMPRGFVGRAAELARLHGLLEEPGPAVVQVHGIGGIGKSGLLSAFAHAARERGAIVVRLDCRAIEPTVAGLVNAISEAIGRQAESVLEVTAQLGEVGTRVVLTFDTYEVFRNMDTWLRQIFVPALPEHVRVGFFGREAPVAAWSTAPGWQGLFRSIALGPLKEQEAAEMLDRLGLDTEQARRVNRFALGHPLAITLAAGMLAERPNIVLEEHAAGPIAEELTRLYLADVRDPLTRQALDAASVVRRTTRSLLHSMLPAVAPQDAFDRLAALPFVELSSDGLLIHDTVREAIAATLKAADPTAYRDYRRAAWRQLRAELRAAGRTELWRYTADMLYLVENSIIREQYFPSGTHRYAIEPALPKDAPAIRAITARYYGPEAARAMVQWLPAAPQAFTVARDRDGSVSAYCLLFEPNQVLPAAIQADPVTQAWLHDLRRNPLAKGQRVLFCRGLLTHDYGEAPCTELGAMQLEIKRTYMELRPALARVYCVVRAVETYAPVFRMLLFQPVPEACVELDGQFFSTFRLDFGPGSVDGWLAAVVAAELGVSDENLLDQEARELVVEGRRVALSRLEFAVMQYLVHRTGKAVSRSALLSDVWGYEYDGGSNVVDSAVRALRKKLGPRAAQIETVTGVGYRYRATETPTGWQGLGD